MSNNTIFVSGKGGSIYFAKPNTEPVLDHIPARVYRIAFDNERGCVYLEPFVDKFTLPEKIYGDHHEIVSVIFNDYKKCTSSLGAMLVGKKGTGKSLMAEDLSNRAIAMGVPVIFIDDAVPIGAIRNVVETIGPCVVYFEEFGKMYSNYQGEEDRKNEQNPFLSFFSSRELKKVLFVINENDQEKLSDFILNRPQRFKYRINPMMDYGKLAEEMMHGKPIIDSIRGFILKYAFQARPGFDTYDVLIQHALNVTNLKSFIKVISYLNIVSFGISIDFKLAMLPKKTEANKENGPVTNKEIPMDRYIVGMEHDDKTMYPEIRSNSKVAGEHIANLDGVEFDMRKIQDIVRIPINGSVLQSDLDSRAIVEEILFEKEWQRRNDVKRYGTLEIREKFRYSDDWDIDFYLGADFRLSFDPSKADARSIIRGVHLKGKTTNIPTMSIRAGYQVPPDPVDESDF